MRKKTTWLVLLAVSCCAAAFFGSQGWDGKELRSAPTTPIATPTTIQPASHGLLTVHSPGTVADDLNLTAGECHVVVKNLQAGLVLPDPTCTPGAIDPAVTVATLAATICSHGYTATVRPSSSNTGTFKRQALLDYGMSYNPTVEYDHLVPLELGGANSVSNLWPEPNQAAARNVNNPKDVVENTLNQAVCSGKVSLSAAQEAIAKDWTTAEAAVGVGG